MSAGVPAVIEGIGTLVGLTGAGFDLANALFGDNEPFDQEAYLADLESIYERQFERQKEENERLRNTRPRYWSPTQEQLEDIDDLQFRATVMSDAYHRSRLVEKQVDDRVHRFAHRAQRKEAEWRRIAESDAEKVYPFLRYEESPMYLRDLYQNQPIEEILE